jgi:hypothetical protein
MNVSPAVRITIGILLLFASVGMAPGANAGEQSSDDTVFHNGFGEAPEVERVWQGFAIAPVKLDLDGLDPTLVGLGSYRVNATPGCVSCHTYPAFEEGGNPFMGQPKRINVEHYLAGGESFGPVVTRNITPDIGTGLPAGLTYEQFLEAMVTGRDFDCAAGDPPPCPLLQVMPWPAFSHMAEHDLRALYEYLKPIPHADPGM